MKRISEFLNVFPRNTNGFQDLELIGVPCRLRSELALLSLRLVYRDRAFGGGRGFLLLGVSQNLFLYGLIILEIWSK